MTRGIQKIPTGFFAAVQEDQNDRILYTLREYQSNARNHGATEAFAAIINYNHDHYLSYFHNGEKFDEINDVCGNGCTPNISTNKGAAFQGAGMVYSAAKNHQNAELLIGAVCKDRKIVVGRGMPDFPSNSWITQDVSPEWLNILKDLFLRWSKVYNVCYLTKIRLGRTRDDENYLKPEIAAALANICPDLSNSYDPEEDAGVTLHYCQSVVGKGFKRRYLDLESNRTGHSNRRSLSLDGYRERYADDTYIFAAEPFGVPVKGYTVQIEEARVMVSCFAGHRGKSDWLANIRSGTIDGTFSKGKGAEFGKKPTKQAFLVMPCVANSQTGKNLEMRKRFLEGSLSTYGRPGVLMGCLDLQFSDVKSFVTIHVFIDKIGKMTDQQGKEADCSPDHLIHMLDRRADFTLGESNGAHHIMQKACLNTVENVPENLKTWCKKHFPRSKDTFVNFLLGTGAGIKIKNTMECPVDIYDLTGKNPVAFDKVFYAGEQRALAMWHRELNKWLGLKDISLISKTRGVTTTPILPNALRLLKSTEKSYKKLQEHFPDYEIPIFQIDVENLGRITANGIEEIGPEEYRHSNSYVPSRNIVMTHNQNERINLGIVEEVPKKLQNGNPGPGPRLHKDSGGGGSNEGEHEFYPYTDRDSSIIGEYNPDTGMFLFNRKHTWVKTNFNTDAKRGTAMWRHSCSIYNTFTTIAGAVYEGLHDGDFQGREKTHWDADDIYNDDKDWLLNQVLRKQIENNSMILELCQKIQEKLAD